MKSTDENAVTEKFQVPLWHKANLSIDEAVAYSGIGRAKLYEMTNREDCPFVLWIGNRRVIKRKVFDEYIEKRIPFRRYQMDDEVIRYKRYWKRETLTNRYGRKDVFLLRKRQRIPVSG